MSFVTSAVSLVFTGFSGEPNDVTITPGALTHIKDNPNLSLLSTCPSAEFLRGLSAGIEVSFIAGASFSAPLIPFDLPDGGVLCPTIAGFASMFTGALQTSAEQGSSSVIAGATIPQSGNVFMSVRADGSDPISGYRLYQVVADGALQHPDTLGGDLQADSSVFRAASPSTGRVVTGNVAGTEIDRYSFTATTGNRYVVMLDQDPEPDQSITSTRLKAFTISGAIANSPFATNISVVGGNAIGPFTVGSDQTILIDVENAGVGTGTSYRFVVAEFANGSSVGEFEGPQTIPSADPALPLSIPDTSTVTSTLTAAGFSGTISDVDVTLDITHTFDADLDVTLISPTGTRIELFSDVGADGDNFTNTTLDDGFSFNPISSASAPFSSTFRPEGLLSALNGQSANGTWTLEIVDDQGNDIGTLNSWSLKITTTGNTDTAATATGLAAGQFGSGAITPVRDVDFWRRSATAGQLMFAYVDTAGSANRDSRLELIANDQITTIEQADDGGPPGISEDDIKNLRAVFEKAGLSPSSNTTFTTVEVNLDDRDDRADLRAISLGSKIFGGPGLDTILAGLGDDTIDGGPNSDIIVGGPGNDSMAGGSGDDEFDVETEFGPYDDTVLGGDGYDTIFVPSSAQKNVISVCLDRNAAFEAIIDVSGTTTRFDIPDDDVEEIEVDGGDGVDELNFENCGVSDNEVVVYVRGPQHGSGAIYVMDATGTLTEPALTFDGIEQVDLLDGALTRADGSSRLVVVSDESFERGANDTLDLATHLGAGASVNLDPAIFPAGDVDSYQFVAQSTGLFDFHVLFQQNAALPGNGDLNIDVRDSNGDLIASGLSSDDNERVTIPVVKNEVYFLRVFGATGPAINDYDITVVNTPAPVPGEVDLGRVDDSGSSELDNVTFRTAGLHYYFHVDLNGFANEGIAILTPAQAAAGVTAGAAVQVFNNGTSVGFASAVPGTNNTLFEMNIDADLLQYPVGAANAAGPLGYLGFTNFIEAAVTIFDAQVDAGGNPTPVVGRSQLGNRLAILADNTAPLAASGPDLLASSDTGLFNTDNVTHINAPAFRGTGEANTHIRILANGVEVGAGTVGTDATDGVLGNGLGTWEVTSEPLSDGTYLITAQEEDLAGNVGIPSAPLTLVVDTLVPNTPYLDLVDASDSGRNNQDDVTNDNTPTVTSTINDDDRPQVPVISPTNPPPHEVCYRIFDRLTPAGDVLLVDSCNTAGLTTAGFFTDVLPVLVDGVHNLKLEAEDRAGNISDRFLLQVTIDTVAPAAPSIDIDPATSDTGVVGQPATISDRVTSDTATGFVGTAEADSIVRLFADADPISSGVLTASDVAEGLTVAIPENGNQAFPGGQWRHAVVIDLNHPAFFPHDGLREMGVTAEDLAGNVSVPNFLEVFIDTAGPQVTAVCFDPVSDPTPLPSCGSGTTLSVFDPKPAVGPTPLSDTIVANFQDLPIRVIGNPAIAGGPFDYGALNAVLCSEPGNFRLVGDAVGVIEIESITCTQDPFTAVNPATAYVTLKFATPLPDDRFTLTVFDRLADDAGNALDGESNTLEPTDTPAFPSGDGVTGQSFQARFTVDTRPEITTFCCGTWAIDLNGNGTFDPTNVDATNRDIDYHFGQSVDFPFAGNWTGSTPNGFDKLGVFRPTTFQFQLDLNGNGAFEPGIDAFFGFGTKVGRPIAGHWGAACAAECVGLFDGKFWYLDLNGNQVLDAGETIPATGFVGRPIAGDWTGIGVTHVGAFVDNTFFLDIDGDFQFVPGIDRAIRFGFSPTQIPIADDWDGDGIDEIGLWVPDRNNSVPHEGAEWFLDSNSELETDLDGDGIIDALFEPPPTGDPLGLVPLVNQDIFYQFGDELAEPVVGNFDPPQSRLTNDPVTPVNPPSTNTLIPLTPLATLPPITVFPTGDDFANAASPRSHALALDAALQAAIQGRIESTRDRDVFQLNATVSGTISFDLTAPFSALDTKLTVLNAKRKTIATNDNSGRSTNSHLEVNVQAGQTYYIVAQSSRRTTGAYTLALDYLLGQARALTAKGTPLNNPTYLQFTAAQTGSIRLETDPASVGTGAVAELYNSAGQLIGRQVTSGNVTMTAQVVAGESYYIVVRRRGTSSSAVDVIVNAV